MTETLTQTIPVTVTVTHEIPVERIKDLLCNAIEGGSNYWCNTMDRMGGITREQANYRHDVPFVEGGWLQIIEDEPGMPESQPVPTRYYEDIDGKRTECYRLDLEAIKKGLNVFAEKCPHQFADFIAENDDAETGDCFLQCILFGHVIYG